jgi:hypothetical protein
MRQFMLIAAILIFGSTAYGQMLDVGEYEQMQAQRSLVKRSVMDLFIEIESEPDDAFWAMYEEYEQKRMQLGKDRMAALHNYTMTYKEMTEKETDHFMKKVISTRKTYHALIDKYYKKAHSLSGATVAAQFYQVEYYFLSQTRIDILNELPFFGEENLK